MKDEVSRKYRNSPIFCIRRECLLPLVVMMDLLGSSSWPFLYHSTSLLGDEWTMQTTSTSSPSRLWMKVSSCSISGAWRTLRWMEAVAGVPQPLSAAQVYIPAWWRLERGNVRDSPLMVSWPPTMARDWNTNIFNLWDHENLIGLLWDLSRKHKNANEITKDFRASKNCLSEIKPSITCLLQTISGWGLPLVTSQASSAGCPASTSICSWIALTSGLTEIHGWWLFCDHYDPVYYVH